LRSVISRATASSRWPSSELRARLRGRGRCLGQRATRASILAGGAQPLARPATWSIAISRFTAELGLGTELLPARSTGSRARLARVAEHRLHVAVHHRAAAPRRDSPRSIRVEQAGRTIGPAVRPRLLLRSARAASPSAGSKLPTDLAKLVVERGSSFGAPVHHGRCEAAAPRRWRLVAKSIGKRTVKVPSRPERPQDRRFHVGDRVPVATTI
jgi:hypothetical protein